MKTSLLRSLAALAFLPLLRAQIVLVENHSFTTSPLPLTPADGSASGVSDTRIIGSSIAQLTDVNVSLSLTNPFPGGANNGDYVAYLTHGSGFAVLLNRVGKRDPVGPLDPAATFGYADNGFSITLDDQAANGDVHVYRLSLGLGGSHNTPVDPAFVQPLTGAWAPDGRNPADGDIITTPRNDFLSSFNGLPASGAWTLFVADLSAGGSASVDQWSLQLTGAAVPEPAMVSCASALGLLAWTFLRRRRSTRG